MRQTVWKAEEERAGGMDGRRGRGEGAKGYGSAGSSHLAALTLPLAARWWYPRSTRLLSPREVMKITCSDAHLRLFQLHKGRSGPRFPRDTSIPRMNSRLKSTIRPVLAAGCSSASISNCSHQPISDKSMETRSVRPTANYIPTAIWRLRNVRRWRYHCKRTASVCESGYNPARSITLHLDGTSRWIAILFIRFGLTAQMFWQ